MYMNTPHPTPAHAYSASPQDTEGRSDHTLHEHLSISVWMSTNTSVCNQTGCLIRASKCTAKLVYSGLYWWVKRGGCVDNDTCKTKETLGVVLREMDSMVLTDMWSIIVNCGLQTLWHLYCILVHISYLVLQINQYINCTSMGYKRHLQQLSNKSVPLSKMNT